MVMSPKQKTLSALASSDRVKRDSIRLWQSQPFAGKSAGNLYDPLKTPCRSSGLEWCRFRAAKNPSPSEASGDGIFHAPKTIHTSKCPLRCQTSSQRDNVHPTTKQICWIIIQVWCRLETMKRPKPANNLDSNCDRLAPIGNRQNGLRLI